MRTQLEPTPATVIEPSDLLTPEQLAERLHVKLSWVWEQTRSRNRRKNPLPVVRLSPKVIRFRWTAVSQWIENKG
jgi:hypothetical protein